MDWTVKEVASLLGVKTVTVYKYIRTGRLESYRLGGRVFVPQRALHDFLIKDKVGGK